MRSGRSRVAIAFGLAGALALLGVATLRPVSAVAQDGAGALRVDQIDAGGGTVVIDGFASGVAPAPLTVSVGGRAVAADTQWSDRIPLDVAVVLDDAAGQPNGTVQLALQSLAALAPGAGTATRTALVTTGGGAAVVTPLTSDAAAWDRAVAEVSPSETAGSDLLGAVGDAAALLERGEPGARRAVVVIAATPERGTVGLGQVERDLVAAQASIESVVLDRGAPVSQLGRLAQGAGGDVTPVASDESFDDAITQVAALLAGRFRVETPADGAAATIELTAPGASTSVTFVPGSVRRGPAALMPPVAAEPGAIDRLAGNGIVLTLAILLGVGAGIVVVWTFVGMLAGRRQLESRLGAYDESAAPVMPDGPPVSEVATVPILQRAVAITGNLAQQRGMLERLEADLERANLPLRAAEALFFALAGAVLASVFTLFLTGNPMIAVVVLLVAALLPKAIVNFRVKRRTKAFEAQLPDMLDLLAGTLRAGYSIAQGVEAVSREIDDPMRRELQRVVNEHRLGRSLEESLDGVAARMGSEDFAWAVMAIRIQREVGGNLAELLLTVSKTMTQRERLRRDVASLTAEGRMSAMVLGLMPFILGAVMFVINPEYVMALLTPGLGYVMLGASLVSMFIGFIWMKKLITVEV